MRIDYAGQTLWLLPRAEGLRLATAGARARAPADAAATAGRSDAGIAIQRVGDEWRLASWREGSAAVKSGLALGDRVVSIDGRRIVAMEAGAEDLLSGAPGSTVMGVVNRGGMDRVFTLHRGGTTRPTHVTAKPALRGAPVPVRLPGTTPLRTTPRH